MWYLTFRLYLCQTGCYNFDLVTDSAAIQQSITDPLFRRAVDLLDTGNAGALASHLDAHPHLLSIPAAFSESSFPSGTEPDQYFHEPRLLWFVAENPIRNESLPDNIAEVAQCIIDRQRVHSGGTLQRDLDYTLKLVTSGRTSASGSETGRADRTPPVSAIPATRTGPPAV